MDAFSPISSLVGGALIGLACAVLWLGNGRIAGISGIFGQLLPPARTFAWRILFLASMIVAALAASFAFPDLGLGGRNMPGPQLVGGPVWLAISGLLVGLGTKIGNGCTSGHGVCGIARLSLRSFVAVGVFFGVAIVTVALTRMV